MFIGATTLEVAKELLKEYVPEAEPPEIIG
jgi:hypothetical protein